MVDHANVDESSRQAYHGYDRAYWCCSGETHLSERPQRQNADRIVHQGPYTHLGNPAILIFTVLCLDHSMEEARPGRQKRRNEASGPM